MEDRYQTFAAYFNGHIETPPPDALAAIAQGMGLDLAELLAVTEYYAPILRGLKLTPPEG
jgi:hypothetical protein